MGKQICIIDGQGGGIGATLIKYLRAAYGETLELIALGTNAIATAQMLRAGANKGAPRAKTPSVSWSNGRIALSAPLPLHGPTPCSVK